MGSGFKNFTAASVLTASDVNNYLMEQSVMSFASTGARDVSVTAPEDGMVAYIRSNDSSEGLYTYNGTSWRRGPGWNAPWGVVATANSTAGTSAVTTTETVQLTSSSYTALSSRYYKATFITTFAGSVAGDLFQVQLRKDNEAGTSFGAERFGVPANPFQTFMCVTLFFTTTAAAQTVCATLVRIGGSGNASIVSGLQSQIIVEDIGPSGAPT
jgi:hypothetical protein